MEKKIARILSVVLHPLLVPSYFVLILYNLPLYSDVGIPVRIKNMVLLFVFLMTFALPVLIVLGIWLLKLIKDLEMQNRQERIIPMVVISVFFYITFYSIRQLSVFEPLTLFMLGSTVLVLLGLILNYFYKISQHMIGWGGFAGALLSLSYTWHTPLYFWIFGVLLASGLAGYARLKTASHTPVEVYSGWLLGAGVMAGLFLFL